MTRKACPNCGSSSTVPITKNWLLTNRSLPLWHCLDCKHQWGTLTVHKEDAAGIDSIIKDHLDRYPGDRDRLIVLIKNH